MAIKLNETNEGEVLEVQVSGKLAHEDYQHFIPVSVQSSSQIWSKLIRSASRPIIFCMRDFPPDLLHFF